jgi:hypothetical protein
MAIIFQLFQKIKKETIPSHFYDASLTHISKPKEALEEKKTIKQYP